MRKSARWLPITSMLMIATACSSLPIWTAGEVPFIPTPPDVVDRMLEMAGVKNGDVLYDLGSGDGRIVIQGAKRYGVRGVGIEIDADLVQRARDNASKEKVDHLVSFALKTRSQSTCHQLRW